MRVTYLPHSQKAWEQFFLSQAVQSGHGLVGFRGAPYQRGAGFGSLLGGLFRSILPVAKNIGKAVGKQALRTGTEVAVDALSGRNIGESLEERGKTGALTLLAKGVKKLDKPKKRKKQKKQKGRGLGFRPRRTKKTTIKTPARRSKLSRAKRKRSDQLGSYFA